MRRVSDTQAVIGESVVIVGIGCNIDIAVVETIVREVPISDFNVRKLLHKQEAGCIIRLVEANSMCQDLDCGIGRIAGTGHAELSADIVSARGSRVIKESDFGEVPALLRLVLDEGGRVKIGLWDSDVEDTRTRRDVDWHGHVHAYFSGR